VKTRTLFGTQIETAAIRRIDIDEPSRWVIAGWRDLMAAPAVSLAQGALFVIVGYVIFLGLHGIGLDSLIPVAIAGFFLVAPALAVGLYEISRRLELGQTPTFADSIAAFRQNYAGLAGMGLLLMLCMAAWTQVALLIFMMFFHAAPPALDSFFGDLLTSPQTLPFLLTGTAIGYVIASVVFSITAVSLPMLLDRKVPVIVAVATSIVAVRENWRVMLGWAATIVVLVGIGVITGLLGLAVTLPLVAHATWHAYRSLVE
jgi:uncharacterized membrane protein